MDGRPRLHRAGASDHECVPLKLPDFIREWLKQNRDWLAHVTPFVVAVVSVILVTLTFTKVDVLARLETLVADYRIAIFTPPEPQDAKIVIAAINEDTLAQFPYREPVNRAFLANLITAIAAKHPKAIGLDILLDNPSEPAGDAQLRQVLHSLTVPIAISYTIDSGVVTDEQSKFLDAFYPAKDRSFATLASDNHDIVRSVYPGGPGKDGKYIPSFALALAKFWGVNAPDVQVPIVWHGQPDANTPPFAEYPSQLVPILPESFFKGRIVLIGSDLSLTDRHTTPFDVLTSKDRGQLPGIVVQANALSQLLDQKPQQQVGAFIEFLIGLLCAGIGAALGWVNWRLDLRIGLAAVFVAIFWVFGFALFYYEAKMINLVIPTISLALSLWATESLTGLEARRQREFIQGAFSRYVSPKVVDQLVKDPEKLSLQGERRTMTLLFTDIANFTTMSEGIEGHTLQKLLNDYLEGMTSAVLKYNGYVDKFIGDAVMAIFNAPLDDPDHAQNAVNCALEMDRFTEKFHLEQKAQGIPFGITRIGVHTGSALVGNFGSSTKFNYTAQGDAVNIASRLEGLNKTFGTHISVSEATKELCHDIVFRPIASVTLKGKTKALEVWEPMQPDYKRLEFLKRYDAAFEQMKAKDPDALKAFQALHEELPGDPCVALHFERLQAGEVGIAVEQHEK